MNYKQKKLSFILLCSLWFISTILFFVGYHNVDLGTNLLLIQEKTETKLIDYYNINQFRTPKELYMDGLDGLMMSYILSSSMFVCFLFYILTGVKKY